MSQKKEWISKIVPNLAFAAGIIIASVGGMMTLSSTMKLALFDSEPYSIISQEECRYDYSRSDEVYERTDIEINECVIERKAEELERFQNNQKRNIVDGVSALVVGGMLLLLFRRRK